MTEPAQKNEAGGFAENGRSNHPVIQLEEEIFAAFKDQDVESLDRILADDFVYRSPGNPEVAKDSFLKLVASFPYKIVSIRGEEMKVNDYGDTAVMTGLQIAETVHGQRKKQFSAVMFTDVFVKRDGRWKLSLAHAVDLPQVPNHYLPRKDGNK
jgi:ketosteroid isomerase-like protein